MKKIFLLLAIFTTTQINAQLFTDLGVGAAYQVNEMPKKYLPMFKLSVGYEFSNIVIEAIEQVAITRQANSPNYFGLKIGYHFNGFVPSAGYLYNYSNSDNPENNGWYTGVALKYQLQVNDNGGLYVEGLYINKSAMLTVGIHYQF